MCPVSSLLSVIARIHLVRDLGIVTHRTLCRWLTAPESVGRWCAQLRGSGADLALGPRLVHEALAFWMQTIGTTLLAVKWRSLIDMWLPAQDSRSAHGLLYLAAVRTGGDEREQREGRLDSDAWLGGFKTVQDAESNGASCTSRTCGTLRTPRPACRTPGHRGHLRNRCRARPARHPCGLAVAGSRASPPVGARANSSRSQHRFSHIAGLAMESAWHVASSLTWRLILHVGDHFTISGSTDPLTAPGSVSC